MEIPDLLPNLPGGKTYYFGLQSSGLDGKPVNLDATSLLWVCANACSERYLQGDYGPSAALFQERLIHYHVVRKWDLLVVFDGVDPPEKVHERCRRQNRLRNTSTYIALCAKICHCLQIPYVIAPKEADFQAVMARSEKNNSDFW